MELDLFVYGTLMPGHLRWSMLAAHTIDRERATAPGRLFDTGQGWPAAQFAALVAAEGVPEGVAVGGDGGVETIPGWLIRVDLPQPHELLTVLDAMEGISEPPVPAADPYLRAEVEVVRSSGERVVAWAYHATRVGPRWQLIDRWQGADER
jgi:gamma-glutamylcyclotransferase (GGCT)/AIG2-like uncharacterized protein YtfP